MKVVALAIFVASAGAMELTAENWDGAVAGKSVFVKFLAPWCGHCKSMKPAWDKLMEEFKGSATALIGDVDCTAGGESLCSKIGVSGYPTIKHGDPNDLKDYEGGRDFDSLKKFAEENLGPTCGPANLDLCDADKKALIEKFTKMSDADLEAGISDKTNAIEKLETGIKEMLESLQKQYKDATEQTKKEQEEITASGLGLMKAVRAHKKAGNSEL